MKFKHLILSLLIAIFPTLALGQVSIIWFENPSASNDLKGAIKTFRNVPNLSASVKGSLSQLSDSIQNKLTEDLSISLPQSWEEKKLFYLSVFYTWKSLDDPSINIVVEKREKGELLFIDFNNDEIIDENQKGFFFPYSDDRFEFWIQSPSDPKQRTGRVLLRLPLAVQGDSTEKQKFIRENFDPEGSLNSYWTNYWRRHNPEFDGAKNSFYYTDRLNLRKGYLAYADGEILIGLYDYSANGLYNDDDDKIFVDLNQDKHFYLSSKSELFNIQDTLTINEHYFILTHIDKYGRYVQVKEVGTPLLTDSSFLIFSHQKTTQDVNETGSIKASFLQRAYRSLDNTLIEFQNYTSDYLLLNFWGEWCGPCIAEIPDLEKLNEMPGSKIDVISFLKTGNLDKAKKIISEENLDWKHIKVTEKIEKAFHISSYPTNILVNLNNMTFYQFGTIDHQTVLKLLE